MRFITEFEIIPPYTQSGLKSHKGYAYCELGALIGDAFGWEERGATTLDPKDPIKHVHKLEIEAFPMDKWVEFKKHLFLELDKEEPSSVHIHELIKELESFGKPEEETTPQDLKKCPHCDNLASSEFHKCPYKEDVNNDSESECNCCEKCTHECAMDI